MPNLTLPTLAALIPDADWDIEIQDELVGPLDFDRDYDLVLITVTTAVAARAYEAARLFRHRGAKVVLGGIHPSVLPDEAAQHADAVVIGEGELTLPRLLEDFRRGKLDTLYRMPHMVDRWDRRPPRWDLLPQGYGLRESLTATRGCHYRCTFCSIHLALGGGHYGYRKTPPAAVAHQTHGGGGASPGTRGASGARTSSTANRVASPKQPAASSSRPITASTARLSLDGRSRPLIAPSGP